MITEADYIVMTSLTFLSIILVIIIFTAWMYRD